MITSIRRAYEAIESGQEYPGREERRRKFIDAVNKSGK